MRFYLQNFGPCKYLGEKPDFFVSLGIIEILGFSELSVYAKIVLLKKPFHITLDYASTANIEEVMKFYDVGELKTFTNQINLFLAKIEY